MGEVGLTHEVMLETVLRSAPLRRAGITPLSSHLFPGPTQLNHKRMLLLSNPRTTRFPFPASFWFLRWVLYLHRQELNAARLTGFNSPSQDHVSGRRVGPKAAYSRPSGELHGNWSMDSNARANSALCARVPAAYTVPPPGPPLAGVHTPAVSGGLGLGAGRGRPLVGAPRLPPPCPAPCRPHTLRDARFLLRPATPSLQPAHEPACVPPQGQKPCQPPSPGTAPSQAFPPGVSTPASSLPGAEGHQESLPFPVPGAGLSSAVSTGHSLSTWRAARSDREVQDGPQTPRVQQWRRTQGGRTTSQKRCYLLLSVMTSFRVRGRWGCIVNLTGFRCLSSCGCWHSVMLVASCVSP